jgi:Uma2 family endonuclease
MSAQPQPRLTPEQYLEQDRASEFRNEYYAGRMYAMSGGTHTHAIVAGNLTSELRSATGKRCMVTQSDLRVRVSPSGLYTYPDIVVVCGQPQYVDGHRDTLANPILVAEVLSPSTEAYDRGFKSVQYRTLESLQEYVLVSQSEPRVEVYRRQAGGTWLLSESAGLEASCTFESLGCSVQLKDIYSQVTFEVQE